MGKDHPTEPKPDYGIDAPGVIRNLLIAAVAGCAAHLTTQLGLWSGIIAHVNLALTGLGVALGCGVMAVWMIYDSKIGKLRERDKLLDLVPWQGHEAVLDVGCGRGLLLIGAAKRLTTGDMRKMTFPDGSFDMVVSNVAIHNVYDRDDRSQTIREIVRVLRPGGRVVIHDIRHVTDYASELSTRGLVDVARIGSPLLRIVLLLITFGSLRPDVVTARKR